MDLLDTLGQVGSGIDKFTGGRALRGTLAGKPRELLSVLPWSDSAGLTDANDATSGRDLTDAYGLTSKGDQGFGANAAGTLADIALNPASLAGGYGAFKAAPTVGKGLVAGAKALTGLDLLDQVKAGGKTIGRFLGEDLGAAGHPLAVQAAANRQRAGLETPGPLKDLYDQITGMMGGDPTMGHAALAQGPRYEGGTEKLFHLIDGTQGGEAMINALSQDPATARRLAAEIPEGSKYLGGGVEGKAFETPQNSVIRMTQQAGRPVSRLDIPEMVMPHRSMEFGGHTVEHLPMITPMDDLTGFDSYAPIRKFIQQANANNPEHVAASRYMAQKWKQLMDANEVDANTLLDSLNARGIDPWDLHGGNYGVNRRNNLAILDPGSVQLHGASDQDFLLDAIGERDDAKPWPADPRWSDEIAPNQYQFPLLSIPDTPEVPYYNEIARQEARNASVPDLIRQYLTDQAQVQPFGHMAPTLAPHDPNAFAEIMNDLRQRYVKAPMVNPDSANQIARKLRDVRGVQPYPVTGAEALQRMQDANEYIPMPLEDWLRNAQYQPAPALLATLLGGGALAAHAENN